jgi:hypothetical protein
MRRSLPIARSATALAALVLAAGPALAGPQTNRARQAIAEASGKIDAANKAGVSGDVPRLQAEAAASLRAAREDLARGHKEQAIDEANHASALADRAIGQAQRDRAEAEHAEQARAEEAAAAARRQAAAANERAASAEAAASSAAAAAEAARNAPPPAPVVVAVPAPQPAAQTTTVTTERATTVGATRVAAKPAARPRRLARRPVHHATRHASRTIVHKTTTTVTTGADPG